MVTADVPIDLATERILSLSEAARALPRIGGKRPHCSTLWRWCRRGCNGVRLEYARIGRRIVTSEEALSRFAARLAAADRDDRGAVARRRRARRGTSARAIEEAEAALDRAGI